MTNEVTTQEFQATRTTKSGRNVYRDMEDTMLSGNSEERIAATTYLVAADWNKGDMGATVRRLRRVFTTKKIEATVASINAGLSMLKSERPKVDIENATKSDVLAVIQGLIGDGQAKGEKGKWLKIFNDVATAESKREAAKAIRKAEFEARQAQLEQGLISQEEFDAAVAA